MDSILTGTQKYALWTREELIRELMSRDEKQAEFDRLKCEYEHKVSEAYWAQGKNERGAGRKPKLTAEHTATVRELRKQGKTFRYIAKETGLSLGLVHKAANL